MITTTTASTALSATSARTPGDAGLAALMLRYVDGDMRAFAALHSRLAPRLRGLVAKRVSDRAAVDDIVQQTFVKAHNARATFDPQRGDAEAGDRDGAVLAWYFAIARHAALDHLRHTSRRERRVALLDSVEGGRDVGLWASDEPNVEERRGDAERSAAIVTAVRAAIDALPQTQREVVRMHKLEGRSMQDIADELHLRPGAVRVRAHRGYKTLAALLQQAARPLLAGFPAAA
jgi:RNA polymerase sigma-70 factor (ECF subfamily)